VKTLLIRDTEEPPRELRDIVRAGSTEMAEIRRGDVPPTIAADRVVVWDGRYVTVDDRRMCWPDDEDELKVLFQTGG
jgi:hypothetical protein